MYRIRIVSEEIARAYARPGHDVIAYDAPIITRAEHVAVVERAQETIRTLHNRIEQMQRALLGPGREQDYEPPDDGDGIFDEDEDDDDDND